MCKKTMADFMK